MPKSLERITNHRSLTESGSIWNTLWALIWNTLWALICNTSFSRSLSQSVAQKRREKWKETEPEIKKMKRNQKKRSRKWRKWSEMKRNGAGNEEKETKWRDMKKYLRLPTCAFLLLFQKGLLFSGDACFLSPSVFWYSPIFSNPFQVCPSLAGPSWLYLQEVLSLRALAQLSPRLVLS